MLGATSGVRRMNVVCHYQGISVLLWTTRKRVVQKARSLTSETTSYDDEAEYSPLGASWSTTFPEPSLGDPARCLVSDMARWEREGESWDGVEAVDRLITGSTTELDKAIQRWEEYDHLLPPSEAVAPHSHPRPSSASTSPDRPQAVFKHTMQYCACRSNANPTSRSVRLKRLDESKKRSALSSTHRPGISNRCSQQQQSPTLEVPEAIEIVFTLCSAARTRRHQHYKGLTIFSSCQSQLARRLLGPLRTY